MRRFYIHLIALLVLSSCSDVVELDLNNTDSRLVIDAVMQRNESGTTYTRIQLTRSAGFYDEDLVFVNDATITITDSEGTVTPIPFRADGIYDSNFPFIRINNPTEVSYTLNINDNGNIYTATEVLQQTVPLIDVEQETISGFGDDITEITAFFNDPPEEGNFYLFEYIDGENDEVDIGDDEFTNGNRSQTTFFLEDLEAGTSTTITIEGINQRCYNFYETLLQQSDGGGGGPFATQPAVVRGNIINTTNADRFPFGYFRISEVYELEYIVQ